MASYTAPIRAKCEQSSLQILALVVLSIEENLSNGSSQTIKIRVHRNEINSKSNMCTGRDLKKIILGRLGIDGCSTMEVELYDHENGCFLSLEHSDMVGCDLLAKFGKRLRARAYNNSTLEENTLAIEGRFYPFDRGLDINNKRIVVEEDPNEPSGGTAGNVWDGAILL